MTLELKDLKESNEFLNAVIDNINSAVFIVDKAVRIQQFNRALSLLFDKPDGALAGELCGNAIGCAFTVIERSECGQTSHCGQCELRASVLAAFVEKVPTFRKKLVREFYVRGEPVLKHFEYSTKYIVFDGQEMILIIVDDITQGEVQKLALIDKQKRLDEDLVAAAGIQQSLLPRRLPRVDNLHLAWRFLPCEIIGGDIFNVFQLDESRIGCYMLDVSGHGVSSALVAVSVSRALEPPRPFAEVVSPGEICRALDLEYPFERFSTFITMSYVVIDFREGYFVYTNAGHPPLVLLRRDGTVELLDTGGSIIGLEGIMPFEEERRELEEGDKIILYTDGVIERRNGDRRFFGQDGLIARVKELKDEPIDTILAGVLESVMEFGNQARLVDDVSLLGIEYKGGRDARGQA